MASWSKTCTRTTTGGKTVFFNLTDTDEIDENAEEMTSLKRKYF